MKKRDARSIASGFAELFEDFVLQNDDRLNVHHLSQKGHTCRNTTTLLEILQGSNHAAYDNIIADFFNVFCDFGSFFSLRTKRNGFLNKHALTQNCLMGVYDMNGMILGHFLGYNGGFDGSAQAA